MRTFSLKPGLVIRHNDRLWQFRRRQVDNRLQFCDELGEIWVTTETEFYRCYEKRELFIELDQPHLGMVPQVVNAPRDLATFPQTHIDEALRRQQYLGALMDANGQLPPQADISARIAETGKEIADRKRLPSPATLSRWFMAYRLTRCIVRLVPAHWKKGRKAVITGEIENILLDIINEKYLTPERPPILKIWWDFKSRIDQHNEGVAPSKHLILPSRSSVYRYVERLDSYQVDRARLGKRVADRNSRVASTEMQVQEILQRWEIDHTLLDLLVVDFETGKVIGRPYITVVLDRASRMVMAFLIHISAPNTETVLRAIDRAIRPKHDWLSRHPEVINSWPARGLPLRMMPDNAAEFHAGDLYLAFNDLGIELMYPRARGPEMKGAVERFFRTMNMGLIHCLPGTTRSNPRERGDYPSEKFACLTLPELNGLIIKWIVDSYHQSPHRSLKGKTPAEVWRAGESTRPIHLPVDLDSLESILAMRERKVLHHYGVEFQSLKYNSPELGALRQRLAPGEKIEVRYRDELGHVWVYDKFHKVFLQVPCTNKTAIGMSRELFELARADVRAVSGKADSFEAAHKAYQQIMADVATYKRSNKLRQRRQAANILIDREGRARPEANVPTQVEAKITSVSMPFAFDDNDIPGFAVRSVE